VAVRTHAPIRLLIAVATAALLAGCGDSSGSHRAPPSRSTVADPAPERRSCRPAPIHRGAPPRWTAAAWSDSSPGFTLPYALASSDAAGAFFFAHPIRADHPTNPRNKILWIVRSPRDGHPLQITARFGAERSLVVHSSWPANAEPGEIYPSYLNLPRPGCWALTLAWGAHRASIDVRISDPRG
jgi:hypothetical protein